MSLLVGGTFCCQVRHHYGWSFLLSMTLAPCILDIAFKHDGGFWMTVQREVHRGAKHYRATTSACNSHFVRRELVILQHALVVLKCVELSSNLVLPQKKMFKYHAPDFRNSSLYKLAVRNKQGFVARSACKSRTLNAPIAGSDQLS